MAYPTDPTEDSETYVDYDPAQIPKLVQEEPDPKWIRRYDRFFRKMDHAVTMALMGFQVVDEKMFVYNIPTVFGTVEKIVYAMFGETSRAMQDNSGQYNKVRVPIVGITPLAPAFDEARYIYHQARDWKVASERQLNDVTFGKSVGLPIDRAYRVRIMTRYFEDMNQLVEQMLLRFSKSLTLRIGGNFFESDLLLDGISANYDEPSEEDRIKLYTTDFDITAKGWLPQPIRREKSVLAIKIDVGVGDPTELGEFQSAGNKIVLRPKTLPGENLPPSRNF